MTYVRDTIAALATPTGRGGIGVIRVSGSGAPAIAKALTDRVLAPRYATYTPFLDAQNQPIDAGIAIFYPGPDSFTGEDVLELQGHGGPVVLDILLNTVLAAGARLAGPGEFSQRAYLNDKIDLTQAEAIADLINSSTAQAARSAMRSLQGEFSRKVGELLNSVIELRIFVEAAIDFPEEEIDFISDDNVSGRLSAIQSLLTGMLAQAGDGVLLNEGATVVLLGKPNAGKSSLMNRLSGRETSIVTDVPGTTRDVVDEYLQLDGIPLRLVDTAGIRETTDKVEVEGVRRAISARDQADLVIVMLDGAAGADQVAKDLAELKPDDRSVVVLNKVDLLEDRHWAPDQAIQLSTKTGEGIERLKDALKAKLGFTGSETSTFTARRRHITALLNAQETLNAGARVLEQQSAGELLAEELRACQVCLSEITGEFTADDLLGEIFSSFCIGK